MLECRQSKYSGSAFISLFQGCCYPLYYNFYKTSGSNFSTHTYFSISFFLSLDLCRMLKLPTGALGLSAQGSLFATGCIG